MNIIYIIIILTNFELFSQCTGCNNGFQSINLWNINKSCEQYVKNYEDCNVNGIFDEFSYSMKQTENTGSQKWNNNNLEYFYFFDNRLIFNENILEKLKSVKTLLLDGVAIKLKDPNYLLKFDSEYLMFRQNNFYGLLSNLEFSKNIKYLSLDENKLYGNLPNILFSYPQLINLSIEYNNLTGVIPKDLSKAKKLKNITLNNNKLEGIIPESICDLKELKVLHLQYNELNNLPECICDLKKRGVEVELYGNKFCEDIPKCIENDIGFQECF